MKFIKKILKILYIIFKEVFVVGGFLVLILCILEELQYGFVSFWIDFNFIFAILLGVGALAFLLSQFAKS